MTVHRADANFVLKKRPLSFREAEAKKSVYPPLAIAVAVLIFFSILFYGGDELWIETLVPAAIFALGVFAVLRYGFAFEKDVKRLILAPVCALAFFSLAQGVLTLSVLNGSLPFSAALPYSFDAAASFRCALKFLAFAVFVKILLSERRAAARFTVWSLVAIGNFFALLGILRFLLQGGFPEVFEWFILPELRPGVGFGTFVNQNHFAFLMLMNLGLSGALCLYGGLEKHLRLLLSVFIALTLIAVVLTASRGGIISSFVVAAVLVLAPFAGDAGRDRRDIFSAVFSLGKKLAAVAALAAAFVLGVVLFGQERVVQRFEAIPAELESAASADGFTRADVWRAALSMTGAHFFYGVGFGGFRRAVPQYIDISGAVSPGEAHNDYLELAASGGVFAVACGVWFLYGIFSVLKKRFSEPSSLFSTAARVGAVGAFAGTAVHSFFDFGFHFAGNWLFFAALLSLAVYKSNANDSNRAVRGQNTGFGKFSLAGGLVFLSFASLFFGFSRLENRLARNGADSFFFADGFAALQFDADFFETRAFIGERTGDSEAAAENLKRAVELRPNDYSLHLSLGKILSSLKQTESAERAFRRAVELAPLYGEPHFYYGNFLAANGRTAEGFAERRTAFRRNPQYFDVVLAAAWRESEENADETVRLLSPLNASEREKLAAFLLKMGNYAAVADLVCDAVDAGAVLRGELVTKLFEKRQYFQAFRVFRGDCAAGTVTDAQIVNGDFEFDELSEGSGFGWRVGDLPDAVKIGFDATSAASGRRSLSVAYEGNFEPALPIFRQMVIVEKNRRYNFSFAYRAERITSGGVPVLQLIFKNSDGDFVYREFELTDGENGWAKKNAEIRTGEHAEALEIRLARRSCADALCPIFGRLWLDDFILK